MIDTGKINKPKLLPVKTVPCLGAVWVASFVCTMLAGNPQYAYIGIVFQHLIL